MQRDLNALSSYIAASPSVAHGVAASARILEAEGFEKLDITQTWHLQKGGRYYADPFGSCLFAFRVGEDFGPGQTVRLAAGHLDVPCFKIKPDPEQLAAGCLKLNIEPYGGMINSTWLDRPLSLAGTAAVKGEAPFKPDVRLVAWEEPMAIIPNLAIHMNREVNKGVELKANRDLLPLMGAVKEGFEKKDWLVGAIAQKLGVAKEDVLAFELCLYEPMAGVRYGLDGTLFSAPRLDNLTSCFACLAGLTAGSRKEGINAVMLYDNEETGSQSKQGADGMLTETLLEKAFLGLGLDRSHLLSAMAAGMLLSCDVAHAVHPNRGDMADATCHSLLNRGVTVKMNFRQRYPTDIACVAAVEQLCRDNGIPCQRFMNRADLAGGGTIGAYASSLLTMPAVDVGVPILAMHSAVETMGAADQDALNSLAAAFFARA